MKVGQHRLKSAINHTPVQLFDMPEP